jgi:hypothetical protein
VLTILLGESLPYIPVLLNLGLQYGIPLVSFLILMRVLGRRLEIRGWVKLLVVNLLWSMTVLIANTLAPLWGVRGNLHPLTWWILASTGIANMLVLTPLYGWFAARGLVHWRTPGVEEGDIEPGRSLGRPVAAGLTVLGYIGVLASLIWAITLSSGMSFQATFTALTALLGL